MLSTKEVFYNWLGSCWHGGVGVHLEELAGNDIPPIIDEEIQHSWFDKADWDAVRAYKGIFYKSVSYRLICEAPEDIVKVYLNYAIPITEQQQIALILRDIRNQTFLSRNYFGVFRACKTAQKLIRDYDSFLWRQAIMVNYGWEWEFEQKFGSLANWQKKLKENYNKLTTCNFEELSNILHTIA